MNEFDKKVKRYAAARNTLALAEPLLTLFFLAGVQISGLSYEIDAAAYSYFSSSYAAVAAYGAAFGILYYIFMFIFAFYGSYVVERRFGLSSQSLADWLKDEAKKAILAFALFLVFIEFLYYIIEIAPHWWWFLAAAGCFLFTVLFTKLAPVLILPLFFKFERIDDEDLKGRIVNLAARCGVKILDLFRLELSAKTKKANAALVGIGKTRRVLLGDTLLEQYTKDEVEVVLAHELAHHKLGHLWKLISSAGLAVFAAFYAIKRVLNPGAGDLALFPSMLAVFIFTEIMLAPLGNALSRRLERAADLLALGLTNNAGAFISCMDKLARQNLSDPSPSGFIEIMLYDHPPISKRIEMAKKFGRGYGKKG